MAFTKLTFSKVWTDPTAFPTIEENETKVREDLQVLHDETRDALNQLIDDLEDTGGDGSAASNIGAKLPDGTVSTVQGALDALDTAKQDVLTFDNAPTAGSDNPVKSDGIKSALDTLDAAKQDVLTFDSVPTASSDNPVTSDGLFNSFAALAAAKQDKLVSGSNIKTVNSTSLLGSGNVAVQETLVSGTNIKTVNSTSLLGSGNVAVQPTLVSGTNIKTINSSSVLGSGDISLLTPSGDSSSTTVTFTEAGSRTNIATGETLAVLFGKIKKFFTDLGTAAFKDSTDTVSSGSTDLVESGAVYSAIPAASTSTPSMDGAGAAGTDSTYSRGDHVHPSDTSKQDTLVSGTNVKTINGNSILGSGNITISGTGNQYVIDYGVTSSSDIYSNFLGGADLYLVNETGFGIDTPFTVAVDSDLSSSSSVYLDVDLFGHYTGGGYIRYHVAGTTWTEVESEEYLTARTYVTAGQKAGTTLGNKATAEGNDTTASGNYAHAEGNGGIAAGNGAHAEGHNDGTVDSSTGLYPLGATGNYAHAEGNNTTASGINSHAEGIRTIASGDNAHTEGQRTVASGGRAHAEGTNSQASGNSSHAEGQSNYASGVYSHAEGTANFAKARGSHVEGAGNSIEANQSFTHMGGVNALTESATGKTISLQNKKADGTPDGNPSNQTLGKYAEVIGNGDSDATRSNARTLDWDGNEVLAGKLTVGADPTADLDVATKQYVDRVFTYFANNTVAPFYDATATYTVGDIVRYEEGRLYVCTTAIATAEAWTAAHWTEISIKDFIPVVATASAWGTERRLGTLSGNVSITLPAILSYRYCEMRITAHQGAGNSHKITLVAPTGVTITDGVNSGSSIEITPTAGKYIEISAAVIESVISVLTNEV